MSKSAAIFAAMAAMMWMAGCADKDPVSSQNEGADSAAGKLVISKTKAGGRCELPPCKGSAYWGDGISTPPPSPGSGGSATPPKALTATLPGGAKMDFVWIEPGTFLMGSPSSEPDRQDDEVQHQVTISKGFYLGKYEITQGQWEAVMGSKPWVGLNYVQENPNNPAVYISWNDLQEFCQRLNTVAGAGVYRLPTEAEWEYACRAGTATVWSFGDSESLLKDYAWYNVNAWNVGEQYSHAVGIKKPNPWGVYDMPGNAVEWVQDWYGEYSSGAQTDPQGPVSGSSRVIRGGGVDFDATYERSAYRGSIPPIRYFGTTGGRLVRTK